MRLFTTALAGLLVCTSSAEAREPAPLAVYGNRQTFEIAPVLLAAEQSQPPVGVRMGGIANLVGEPGVAGFSEAGAADLATNAETQLLRASVAHPELRVLLGVSEGLYRIVARRSAGIATIADLKDKRIATIVPTSAGYFLDRMLRRSGLTLDDVEVKPILPLSGMSEALLKREADAVAIWEPEAERAAQLLGPDFIEFSGEGTYRELFNLNTTAAKLADPASRERIVRFVRSVIDATAALNADPTQAQALVAAAGPFEAEAVSAAWRHQRFTAQMPADLLDVLTEEEQWLAARDKRPARSRGELAKLIDFEVYREALALQPAH